MSNIIAERIALIRKNMAENGIDTYLLTKLNPHQSEYSISNWNYVKYFSGFTGSAGIIVITGDKAAFWTDGRYSLQSKNELNGTEYIIFNTSNPDCVSYEDFIIQNTSENGTISFDERTLSVEGAKKLINAVAAKNIIYKSGVSAIEKSLIGIETGAASESFIHDLEYCGVNRSDKLVNVREKMAALGADTYVLSALEDIAWLYNVRSKSDPAMSFEAYSIIAADKAVLFVDEDTAAPIKDELSKNNVEICGYNDIYKYIPENLNENNMVAFAPSKTCHALYSVLSELKTVEIPVDITAELKAVKNKVEIENTKKFSLIDGASLVKFIIWIKEAAKTESISEYAAGKKLDDIRAREEKFLRPSFSTICGYGPNGAIIHYRADENKSFTIKPEGFLLVDSGGSYLGATTDITRTIVLGKLSDEMKDNFTLVLKSHIALAKAIFLKGTTGHYLDILARKPLWDHMLDYKHGTGHGIGFALSVHEGPQRIAPQANNISIVPGMMTSNEPGYYKDNEYGVRSENIILTVEHGKSDSGEFYAFETLSFAPFDLDAINKNLLTQDEIDWLNNYHSEVFEKLSPLLEPDEIQWLKEATKSI